MQNTFNTANTIAAMVSKNTGMSPASSMDAAINELFRQLGSAEVAFERLGDRLKPVRNTNGCSIDKEQCPAPTPQCQIEEQILQAANRIATLLSNIEGISSQVCV